MNDYIVVPQGLSDEEFRAFWAFILDFLADGGSFADIRMTVELYQEVEKHD